MLFLNNIHVCMFGRRQRREIRTAVTGRKASDYLLHLFIVLFDFDFVSVLLG